MLLGPKLLAWCVVQGSSMTHRFRHGAMYGADVLTAVLTVPLLLRGLEPTPSLWYLPFVIPFMVLGGYLADYVSKGTTG